MKGKHKHINGIIRQLPAYSAPDKCWDRINSSLTQVESTHYLQKAIADLPTYEAPPSVKEAVLPPFITGKTKNLKQWYRWLSGTAAALMLTVGLLWQRPPDEKITLTYSQEVITDPSTALAETMEEMREDDDLISLIDHNCKLLSSRCESEEFEALFQYYLELKDSKKELIDALQKTQQLQLMDYLIRVEKEKNEIGKQLLQIVIG